MIIWTPPVLSFEQLFGRFVAVNVSPILALSTAGDSDWNVWQLVCIVLTKVVSVGASQFGHPICISYRSPQIEVRYHACLLVQVYVLVPFRVIFQVFGLLVGCSSYYRIFSHCFCCSANCSVVQSACHGQCNNFHLCQVHMHQFLSQNSSVNAVKNFQYGSVQKYMPPL